MVTIMGPLARHSLWRMLRSGVWGVLVAGAFLVLGTAAAAAPLFAEAAGNAALGTQLEIVPPDAVAAVAPVVRVVGGLGAAGRVQLGGGLDEIPGLTRGLATASSVGLESRPKTILFTPFVAAGPQIESKSEAQAGSPAGSQAEAKTESKSVPAKPAGLERARIFGDDDLAHTLVPALGSVLPSSPATTPTTGAQDPPGIWLAAPVAADLKVGVGDPVTVGVQFKDRARSTPARVAGIYQVGPDGRVPADPAGRRTWQYRRGELPADSEFTTLPSFLLITDVSTAEKLAVATGDELLYAVEGRLRAARPTLTEARATVAGIHRRQVEVRDPALIGDHAGLLREQVVSGLPTIVADAGQVADRGVAWTRTVGTAGLVLGLLAVLAVAVFGLVRRSVELRHATGLGVRPAVIGIQAGVEVLAVALLGAGGGLLLGWGLVAAVGPPGAITEAGLRAAAAQVSLAVGAGALLVAVAATLAAIRAEQLTAQDRRSRTLPWELLLLAIAVTAAAGLFVRPADDGPPSLLDLLVPVLVLAASGAVGARLLLPLAAVVARRSPSLAFTRRPVSALAVRRVAAGGRPAVLLITVLTLGFGFLIYSLAAASAVRQVTADRAAVQAGARATTAVEASWLLDPGAPRLPPTKPDELPDADPNPVPGTRTPPLPAGVTIVWRGRITVPPEYGNLDLLVVDPRQFAEVASWGTGPELGQARARLRGLAAADTRATAELRAGRHSGPIPAIGVGAILQRPGDAAAISTEQGDVPITIMDVVSAFPGASGEFPAVVVPADSYFSFLGRGDPRVRPPAGSGRFERGPTEYFPSLWSSTNLVPLQAVLASNGLEPGASTSYQKAAEEPDLVAARGSIGYQVALGWCVAGLAMLALAMFAERSVARSRAADLMLTRMGLGRRGITRARAAELAALAVLSLVLAGVGVGVIVPLGARLLDPGGGSAPAFVLRLDPSGLAASMLAVAVAVLVALLVSSTSGRSGGSAREVLRDVE